MHLGGNLCWVPLTCDNCKKSFPENRSLVSYLKTFHEQLSFNCNKIVFQIIQQTWRRCSKSSWNIILRTMPMAIITEFSFLKKLKKESNKKLPVWSKQEGMMVYMKSYETSQAWQENVLFLQGSWKRWDRERYQKRKVVKQEEPCILSHSPAAVTN